MHVTTTHVLVNCLLATDTALEEPSLSPISCLLRKNENYSGLKK